jgi:hypothetical protein
VEFAIFNPGPPTVITPARGFGGRGKTIQKNPSRPIMVNTIDEMTTTQTRRERDAPVGSSEFRA